LELVYLKYKYFKMKDITSNSNFLIDLIDEISVKDKLQSKKIKENIQVLNETYPVHLNELSQLIEKYFHNLKLSNKRIAEDYLKMIQDMRTEGLYFYRHGKYRCANQKIAEEYVYAKPEVMTYYMNALLVSQIMWKHHFNIFMFFQNKLKSIFPNKSNLKILDIGPGHGFFSYLTKKEFSDYEKIDLVDISETSLEMTKKIIGYDEDKINYFKKDVFDYDDTQKYDFIVLGEVLEHLDDPKQILSKLSKLLSPDGVIWLTTPTNAPALDHVYLFKTKEEVVKLVTDTGLKIVESCNFFSEEMEEQKAIDLKITNLVGLFCKN